MGLKEILIRYKPGVSIRMHLLLGALIWTVVGFFLLTNGFVLVLLGNHLWYGIAGLLLGGAKAFFVIDRLAKKNIKRIKEFEDKVCFGSVYSLKTWFMVLAMIGLGRFLRTTLLPGEVIGLIYTAVGCALMLSSRLIWIELKRTSK
jgi:hypothetical protein